MLRFIPLLTTLTALLAPVMCLRFAFEPPINADSPDIVEIFYTMDTKNIQLDGINYNQFKNISSHTFAAVLKDDLEVTTTIDAMSSVQIILSSQTDDDSLNAWPSCYSIYSQRKLSQFSLRFHYSRAAALHERDSGGGIPYYINDIFAFQDYYLHDLFFGPVTFLHETKPGPSQRLLDPDNFRWAPHDQLQEDNVIGCRCLQSHTRHAIDTVIPNYCSSEADHFQIQAIPNRFSPCTGPGLELLSVKETYSGWSMRSAILLLCHRHKDSWHHPLSKSGYNRVSILPNPDTFCKTPHNFQM